MSKRHVEVLVFDGCPNVDMTVERAHAAIMKANIPADVRVVRVESEEDANRLHFLGSPSVRVDGVDIEQSATSRDDFGLQCRVYTVGSRLEGAPPTDWIASALRGESHRDDGAVAPAPAAHGCCSHGGDGS
jgi:hypothetical protein